MICFAFFRTNLDVCFWGLHRFVCEKYWKILRNEAGPMQVFFLYVCVILNQFTISLCNGLCTLYNNCKNKKLNLLVVEQCRLRIWRWGQLQHSNTSILCFDYGFVYFIDWVDTVFCLYWFWCVCHTHIYANMDAQSHTWL